MDEIDKVIEPSEKILWKGKPRYAPFMTSAVFGALLILVLFSIFIIASPASPLFIILVFFFAVILVVIQHLRFNVTHYAITNKRVVFQKGIIGRDFVSVDYDKVQNASVNVGLVGVIFKVGNVRLFTGKMSSYSTGGGRHGSRQTVTRPVYDVLAHVDNPYDLLKKVQQHLSYRKESMYGGYGHPAGKANRHHK